MSQEKSKTMLMQFFWGEEWGGGGVKEVCSGICASSEYLNKMFLLSSHVPSVAVFQGGDVIEETSWSVTTAKIDDLQR